MSTRTPIGLAVAEKLLGLILLIIGAVVAVYSSNPPPGDIKHAAGIFITVGIAVAAVGILLIVAKTE